MSVQLLIDAINAGAVSASSPIAAPSTLGRSRDFGDAVAASFESAFPRAAALDDTPKPASTQEPQRFKPGASADFGDRVAAAYDQLFPPRGATP